MNPEPLEVEASLTFSLLISRSINLISYYSATLFEQIGMSPLLSRYLALANGIEYVSARDPTAPNGCVSHRSD